MLERWHSCVARLEAELPAAQFIPWIKPLIFRGYDEGSQQLRLGLPSSLKLNFVRAQFEERIVEIAREVFGSDDLSVTIELCQQGGNGARQRGAAPLPAQPDDRPASGREQAAGVDARASGEGVHNPFAAQESDYAPDSRTRLRPDLSFENFVHGKANQIAISAMLQVAERPGRTYNPLFLYGGVGLGKTHLIHAVGNAIVARVPSARVLYVHAQEYFDEMVRAIQRKTPQEFKRKYQSLDLLLIDDIQFLGGKERTQEEFFYTFEAMFSARKQLIITSDTYPRELSEFKDRLVSRLGSGLIVEIEPPELEMRVAILLKKAEVSGVVLPEDAAFFIAKHLRSNVRELEGALLRVIAFARFREKPINADLAREALKDLLELNRAPVSIDAIQRTVAEFFQIKVADMYSKRRPAHIARSRQVAMYFAKEFTQKSFPEIGEAFGGRDHTTVMHAVKRIAELRQHDPEWNRQLHVLEQTLRG